LRKSSSFASVKAVSAVVLAADTNRPVFAYFTADWCLSCKVNEAAAIERSSVRDAFVLAAAAAGLTVTTIPTASTSATTAGQPARPLPPCS
jgi:thiol:disulfide interchange protein